MAWDAGLADERTKEFEVELSEFVKNWQITAEADMVISALLELQQMWKRYYRTTDHKRLVRMFLKETFE